MATLRFPCTVIVAYIVNPIRARCVQRNARCMIMAEPLLSIYAAAAKIGLNRSTLSRQVNAGRIRSHDGKVLLSEVVADRRNIAAGFSSKQSAPVILSPAVLRDHLKIVEGEIVDHDDEMQVLLARLGDRDALFAITFLLVNAVSLRFGPPEDEPDLSFDEGMEITASTAIAVSNKVLTLVLRQLAVQRSVISQPVWPASNAGAAAVRTQKEN
jgi:hypothetical protein